MNSMKNSIAVLGAGSWGTALAMLFARNGERTFLWGRNRAHIDSMLAEGCNSRYLPGIPFSENLNPSHDLEFVLNTVNEILLAVPSHAFGDTLRTIKPLLRSHHNLLWATKGFEQGTGKLLHEVVNTVVGDKVVTGVISGPTFAKEVARGLPTAVTVASNASAFARNIADRMHNDVFRAYTSDDVIGVEIGGAVKNVLAVAAGIADGLGFGANTRAALITRGLAETMRLGESQGGKSETFMGLTGLGDLVLTCTDNLSRNRRFGLALGQGNSLHEAMSAIDQVVEGMNTTREVRALAQKFSVEMPITEQVYCVLYENKKPKDAVHSLLARVQKTE